jgi:hypothetical protein
MLFAAEPPAPDPLGDTLKLVQIAFFTVGGILAILTYLAAKKAWLTPTNTEYQKKVLERLAKLSEDLYAEFDPSSDTHWAKEGVVRAAIAHMNWGFIRSREYILETKKWPFGTPVASNVERLGKLLHPVCSDPFIPENIREAVIDLLESRIQVLGQICFKEFEKYANNLAKGKQQPLLEDDLDGLNAIHNRCVDAMNLQGCGITSIENAVHDIRGLIQTYFDQFNPHGVGKGHRKRHEKPPESAE